MRNIKMGMVVILIMEGCIVIYVDSTILRKNIKSEEKIDIVVHVQYLRRQELDFVRKRHLTDGDTIAQRTTTFT